MLGALPETTQMTCCAVFKALRLQKNDCLLIWEDTDSKELAAAAIAKSNGAFVAAIARKPEREQLLRANGAEQVFIENGNVADHVQETEGFHKVLKDVGVTSLNRLTSMRQGREVVCMVGSVSGKWAFDGEFSPMVSIPAAVSLTAYHSCAKTCAKTPLDDTISQSLKGGTRSLIGKVFVGLHRIYGAHQCIDEDKAGGKIGI